MPVSRVYMICNAYESGFGHGFECDNLPNPFESGSDEYEAYDIGYRGGLENLADELVKDVDITE